MKKEKLLSRPPLKSGCCYQEKTSIIFLSKATFVPLGQTIEINLNSLNELQGIIFVYKKKIGFPNGRTKGAKQTVIPRNVRK